VRVWEFPECHAYRDGGGGAVSARVGVPSNWISAPSPQPGRQCACGSSQERHKLQFPSFGPSVRVWEFPWPAACSS